MYGNTKGPKPAEQAKRRVAQTQAAKKTAKPAPAKRNLPYRKTEY
jgi:hypothetical protein